MHSQAALSVEASVQRDGDAVVRETTLQQEKHASEEQVRQLSAQVAQLQQDLAKQGARLNEASLVESEKQQAKSELRSVASTGAELVGDVTSQLSQILMSLQSQGTVFNSQLNTSLSAGISPNG